MHTRLSRSSRWRRRRRAGAATVAALVAGLVATLTPQAAADTAPPDPTVPVTVSADVLPTVQINGVVWSQVIVGNRVYATGSFTNARPAGAAAGTQQTPRSNVLAYDLTTGALVTSWAPTLNAQGMAIAASPDGSRIYVVGDFTQANGQTRNRIAAFDATTGALVTSFAPTGTNARARALAVTAAGVYLGGSFSTAGGQSRQRLAAYSPTTGALLSWAPTAEQEVIAMTAPPNTNEVVVGGRFTQLNGNAWYGLGALDATTAANLPFAANNFARDAGPNAAIWSLSSDATTVYGTGYVFGTGGNLENAFAAESATGNLRWIDGCLGDTYGIASAGAVVYEVGHSHNCSQISWFPEQNPRAFQRAIALTSARGANNKVNVAGNNTGRPAPDPLHWLPTIDAGTFTGQSQGAWSVAANSQYVVLGGEFPRINNGAQQGLARFAVRALAPNTQGPQGQADLTPTLTAPAPATARATFTSAWDRDNQRLTYELLRGPTAGGATVVASTQADSAWWTRPQQTLTDTTAPDGAQTYRIRARDPLGNTVVGNPATVTVTGGVTPPPPPVGDTFAADTFDRTVSSGLGSATTGGPWTLSGTAADFSVDGATANFRSPAPGAQRAAYLGNVSQTDADITSSVKLDKVPAGGTTYVSLIGRRVGTDDYRAKIRFNVGGAVSVQLVRFSGGTETAVGAPVTVPGVTYAAGQVLRVRLQVSGTGTTTLAAKAWADGAAEPAAFLVTGTDTTASLQSAGSIGYLTFVSSGATNTPVTVSFDDLSGGPRPAA